MISRRVSAVGDFVGVTTTMCCYIYICCRRRCGFAAHPARLVLNTGVLVDHYYYYFIYILFIYYYHIHLTTEERCQHAQAPTPERATVPLAPQTPPHLISPTAWLQRVGPRTEGPWTWARWAASMGFSECSLIAPRHLGLDCQRRLCCRALDGARLTKNPQPTYTRYIPRVPPVDQSCIVPEGLWDSNTCCSSTAGLQEFGGLNRAPAPQWPTDPRATGCPVAPEIGRYLDFDQETLILSVRLWKIDLDNVAQHFSDVTVSLGLKPSRCRASAKAAMARPRTLAPRIARRNCSQQYRTGPLRQLRRKILLRAAAQLHQAHVRGGVQW